MPFLNGREALAKLIAFLTLMRHKAKAQVASMSINLGSLDHHSNSKFPVWGQTVVRSQD